MIVSAVSVLLAATPVSVWVDACPLAADEVKRLAELELSRGPARPLPVALRCDEVSMVVTVDDPVTKKTLTRTFPRAEMPPRGAERYAAIAIAELVEASWSELLLPAPEVPVTPAGVSSEERTLARETLPTRRVRLGAFGSARGYLSTGVVQWGGGLRVNVALIGPVGLMADVMGASGVTKVSGGRVSADGVATAAFVTATFEQGRIGLALGLGGRLMGERLVGFADDVSLEGRTVSAILGGPAACGEVSVAFGRFEVSALVEAGYLLRQLEGRVDGVAITGLSGAWLTGTLAVGWRL